MPLQYKTYATSVLGSSYTAGDGTATLTSGGGAAFPATGIFFIRFNNTNGTIRKVTSRSTDLLTLSSGTVDSTTDQNATSGLEVDSVLCQSALDQLRADISEIGTFSSIPTSGTAGDIYRCTDAPYLTRWNGSGMDYFGPIYPVTPPGLTSLTTYVSAGSPTIVNKGAININTTTTSDFLFIGTGVTLTAPYTGLDLGFAPALVAGTFAQAGMFLRNSSSGNIISFVMIWTTNGTLANVAINVNQLNNSAGFVNGPFASNSQVSLNAHLYMRISDDGTNRHYQIASTSLGAWQTLYSESNTNYITTNQFGFTIGGYGNEAACMFFHMKQNP